MTRERLNQNPGIFLLHCFFSIIPNPDPARNILLFSSLFSGLGEDCGLHHWLLVGFGQWEALGGNWRAVAKWDQVVFAHSLPASMHCLRQWLGPFMLTATAGQAIRLRLQLSLGSGNTISVPYPRGGNGLLLWPVSGRSHHPRFPYPDHNFVSNPINKVFSFEPSGMYCLLPWFCLKYFILK